MLFNSLDYVFFLPIVVFLYFLMHPRSRWVLLLIASYYFYMCWKVEYALLIVVSTLVDYYAGLLLGKTDRIVTRKLVVFASLVVNLGLLFFFKYFNFVSDSVRDAFNYFNIFYESPAFEVLLPVGISFYTFQTISYTIDVYRKVREPERHLGIFAVYVSFFPQLVAGPIERSTTLLPQFRIDNAFSYENLSLGTKLMLWGFFKKVVIADRFLPFVNKVFDDPTRYTGIDLVTAAYLFAIYLYCDFSGYTDIARGSAKIFGYELTENFRRPFAAKTITDFWNRWNISLTTWFKHYLFPALGGARVSKWRRYFNVFLVFLASGTWHGASWPFVLWGALNGIYIIFSHLSKDLRHKLNTLIGLQERKKLHDMVKLFVVFHLTVLGFTLARSNSVGDAVYIFGDMFNWSGQQIDIPDVETWISLWLIAYLFSVDYLLSRKPSARFLEEYPVQVQWPVYFVNIFGLLVLGNYIEQKFFYFQF